MADWPVIALVATGAALLAGGVAALLARAARPSGDGERAAHEALVARVEDCLPKTQCAQCGYPGCRPYAEAILADETDINRCPPGGRRTIESLAALLGRDAGPIVGDVAGTSAGQSSDAPCVARIVEADCIGCALCLPACPTDAIVGAHKLMHTVIATDCTGCELCLAPCPVDCIVMLPRAPAPDLAARPVASSLRRGQT